MVSNYATLMCSQLGREIKPIIKVDWHIDQVAWNFSELDQEMRVINKKQCESFGLVSKDCSGFVVVRALYNMQEGKKPKHSNQVDWVSIPPFDLLNSKIQNAPELQGKNIGLVKGMKAGCNILFKGKSVDAQVAKACGVNEKFFKQLAFDCSHPLCVPAGWVIGKNIGDTINLQAHGCDVEVTIKSLPAIDSDDYRLLNFLKWQSYMRKTAPVLLVCGIVAFLVRYFSMQSN